MSDEEDRDDLDNENEDGESAEGEGSGEEEGGNKKLFIIIGAVVVLLIGGAAGAYFTGMLDSVLGVEHAEECVEEVDEHGEVLHACPEEAEHGEDEEHAEEDAGDHGGGDGHGAAAGGGKFIEIPTMIVNLNTDDGTPRYLRLSVQLELKSSADYPKVEAVMPRVIDQFQTYLRELRVRDLRGSAGIYRLQMELLWRVNQASAPVKVKDVLFQEILIQ